MSVKVDERTTSVTLTDGTRIELVTKVRMFTSALGGELDLSVLGTYLVSISGVKKSDLLPLCDFLPEDDANE